MTRGLRNNNPGNLRHSANGKLLSAYTGEIRPIQDNSFRTFTSMLYGYRALLHQLNRYLLNGKNTIRKIINTYAPPNENDTTAYIKRVSNITGLAPGQKITTVTQLVKLAGAIEIAENSSTPNYDLIKEAAGLINLSGLKKDETDHNWFSDLILLGVIGFASYKFEKEW